MMANKPRRFKKFVALDERGNVLWGTMDNTPESSRQRFDGYNPDSEGETFNPSIHEVTILLKT